jgi:hypothetical protein
MPANGRWDLIRRLKVNLILFLKCLCTNTKKIARHIHNGNQNPVPERVLRIPHTKWDSATNSIPIYLPVQMALFYSTKAKYLKKRKTFS